MIPTGEQWNEIAALERGDLRNTSYAVLLSAMARTGRSGVLRLARQPVQKQLFLSEGRPVECRSNLAHETFGRFLLSEGQISEDDHESALSESLSRRAPIGEVLIEKELLSPHDIYRALQRNLARKLLDPFTWERGDFEVASEAGPVDTTIKVNAPQLILTGVAKLTPQAEIEAGITPLRRETLAVNPHPVFGNDQLHLAGAAQKIVSALEPQPLGIEQLAASVGLASDIVDRFVYALALLGRVLPAREIEPSRARFEPATATAEAGEAPGTAEKPVIDDQAVLLRQASIVEAYLSFNRKDSFDFLDLEEGATVPEIDQAFLGAAELYAPWTLEGAGGEDFADQAEALFLRAAQAYAELRNTDSRGTLIHRRKTLRDEEAARNKPQFAIETDLLDSEEQFKKGVGLVEEGDLGKAIELLEFAADCDTQNALYRAELAYRRDQHNPRYHRQQSIADLKEAIRIDPKCGLAYYYLGLILADLGNMDDAQETLRRSIKLMAPDRRPIDALKELAARIKKR